MAWHVESVGRTARIPAELKSRPFSLDEARNLGVTKSALRGKSWERVGSRLYRWRGASDDTLEVIRAYRRVLPREAVFVGRTAAWVHGLDVNATDPIQVCVGGLHSRAGLEVRHADVSRETVVIQRVPVTTFERTLLDVCAWLPPVEALVVLDMAVTRIANAEMHQYADAARGRVGASRLRWLAGIAAPAESPMETRLRWLLIDAGLPAPEVQTDLYDNGGEFIGRADLYYASAHLVIEFDGGNHRERLVRDDRRQNRLVRAGYRILRYTSADLHHRPDAIVAEIRGYFSGR